MTTSADGEGGDTSVEAVVVGIGLIGAAVVRHLARAGVDVIGIGPAEPADLASHPGAFASHYDSGRITRRLDARWEWGELASRAIEEYPVLAAESGIEFHFQTGTVFCSTDADYLAALTAVATRLEVPFERIEPGGAVAGGRLAAPAGSTVVAEAAPAGFIDPRRMLGAQLRAAERHGARLRRTEVAGIEPAAGGWAVRQRDGAVVRADRVVVAAGAHTDEVSGLPQFPRLAVRPEAVVLAELEEEEAARLAGIPAVLAQLTGGPYLDLYQVPPTTYPDGSCCLKLGATSRVHPILDDATSRRAWMTGRAHQDQLADLRHLVEGLVPGIRAERWTTKPCLITNTPSGLPIVDHLAPGLVVAAGGNGYAAKSSDAIGALAAGLARDGTWTDPVLAASAFSAAV